jgi:hypothetical protein
MTRRAVAMDRVLVLMTGLALLAAAYLAVGWRRGQIDHGRPLPVSHDPSAATWWPWAVGATGAVLIALGLRWLVAHRWAARAGRIPLGNELEYTADTAAVARAAATALDGDPAVVKAAGSATVQRGIPTVTLTATVPVRHGAEAGVRALDEAAQTVAVMVGQAVAVRGILRVNAKAKLVVR